MLIFQKGFNFSQDGPGNRLVYHVQGCNFNCPWCSNPEGMPLCSPKAKEYSVSELLTEALNSRPMFFDGGGVTFTGGECTLNHGELLELLRLLREAGINTALETNASDRRLSELLPFVDFLMADLKLVDPEKHKTYTGVSNEAVLKNISDILDSGRQILIRIPLINGINTDAEPFAEFFSAHGMTNARVEILPYHEYGKAKWTEPYRITNGFVSDETLNCFITALKSRGITVIST